MQNTSKNLSQEPRNLHQISESEVTQQETPSYSQHRRPLIHRKIPKTMNNRQLNTIMNDGSLLGSKGSGSGTGYFDENSRN